MNLESLSMQTLVAIHNAIADIPATGKTFSQRSKAVARINKIAEDKGLVLAELFNDDGSKRTSAEASGWGVPHSCTVERPAEQPVPSVAPAAVKQPAEQSASAAPTAIEQMAAAATRLAEQASSAPQERSRPARRPRAEKTEKAEKGPVIRKVAEAMLLEVVSHDEDKRPMGHPYEDVLKSIHQQFQGAKTTVACLRWYAVHMRERGERVPYRPRAKKEA